MSIYFGKIFSIDKFFELLYASSILGTALRKFDISKIDSRAKISGAIPTSVDIIGVFVIPHSTIDCGPPSYLDETIYKF